MPEEKIRQVAEHVDSCVDCSEKVARYRLLVSRLSNVEALGSVSRTEGCSIGDDINWFEVVAGLWPEARASQLLLHAALCEHCGPLLRAATALNSDASAEEERLLSKLRIPWHPQKANASSAFFSLPFTKWAFPVLALILIIGALTATRPRALTPLSGPDWARLAVQIHEQQFAGKAPLAIRSGSTQDVNTWLQSNLPFAIALPVSLDTNNEALPFRLQGASLVRVGTSHAALIAYQMASGLATLMVSPDSVAVAAGGVEAHFNKVSFHYALVEGHKVVTWSQHGLTYALVSDEGTGKQQSCMICHSAMRDRDLSHTPTPLQSADNAAGPLWE